MIRVLHIIGSLERAGIETFVINLYRVIDREKIQFDFAIYNKPSLNSYFEEVEDLGGRVFVISPKRKGIIKNYRAIRDIVKEKNYKIVWRGCSNCFAGLDLIAAKRGGATVRILHSHNSDSKSLIRILHYLSRPVCNRYATARFSCGLKAGRWMFGERGYTIVPNGIPVKKFCLNEEKRNEYRDKYNANNRTVIGSIARFDVQKNHVFLIDVFNAYLKLYGNALLLLIGEGELKELCIDKVKKLGIEDEVHFLGQREDIPELLSAMDVLCMPSKYEGFPVTLLEAQAAGLSCVVSDIISDETNIHGNILYVSLNEDENTWANLIHNMSQIRDSEGPQRVIEAGYDVNTNVEMIEQIILKG